MTITFTGYKQYSTESKARRVFTITHKNKSIEYMPVNDTARIFPMKTRECLRRTLQSKYNEIWSAL